MKIELGFRAELIINCFMHHFHQNISTNAQAHSKGEIMTQGILYFQHNPRGVSWSQFSMQNITQIAQYNPVLFRLYYFICIQNDQHSTKIAQQVRKFNSSKDFRSLSSHKTDSSHKTYSSRTSHHTSMITAYHQLMWQENTCKYKCLQIKFMKSIIHLSVES